MGSILFKTEVQAYSRKQMIKGVQKSLQDLTMGVIVHMKHVNATFSCTFTN